LNSTILEFIVTPRDLAARCDLARTQADVMSILRGIHGVSWQYNDPGAQALIIRLPADQLTRARALLIERHMVDPNAGLRL